MFLVPKKVKCNQLIHPHML